MEEQRKEGPGERMARLSKRRPWRSTWRDGDGELEAEREAASRRNITAGGAEGEASVCGKEESDSNNVVHR